MYRVREHRRRAAMLLKWRPAWPFAAVVAVAWGIVLTGVGGHVQDGSQPFPDVSAVELPAHEHHQTHGLAAVEESSPGHHHQSGSLPTPLLDWTVMSIAMMVPLVLPAVNHVGLNSIRRRRRWAMSLFVTVYVGTWITVGLASLTAEGLARQILGMDDRLLVSLALAVASGWQLTQAKRRALVRCRRTVALPPVGRRADAACARFALQQGQRCITSCWALMAVMSVVVHSALLWMIGLTALAVAEELTRFGRRLLRLSAVALAFGAGLVALGI